jgi:hypothetical protein
LPGIIGPGIVTAEFTGAAFGHAAHAFDDVNPRNRTTAHAVIEAIRIAILDPQPLRGA